MAEQGVSMNTEAAVEVTTKDLMSGHSVTCPNPKMPLWSTHPRVFLDVATTGHAKCPYCGTEYRLKEADADGAGGHAHEH
jgi:uncharacterized Zn-finger protein